MMANWKIRQMQKPTQWRITHNKRKGKHNKYEDKVTHDTTT